MLWIQTAGYMLEDLVRLYKIGVRSFAYSQLEAKLKPSLFLQFAAIGFWSLWNWVTYSLVVIAFGCVFYRTLRSKLIHSCLQVPHGRRFHTRHCQVRPLPVALLSYVGQPFASDAHSLTPNI